MRGLSPFIGSLVAALSTLALTSGCALEQAPTPDTAAAPAPTLALEELHQHHDHERQPTLIIRDGAIEPSLRREDDITSLSSVKPFRHIGLLLDGLDPRALELRTRSVEGVWSVWRPIELTWSEGLHHVGRALLLEPSVEVELRGGDGLTSVSAQLYDQWPQQPNRLARDLPLVALPSRDGVRVQALAPANLVIPRAEWGARDPGKICGDVVAPYRMSIHHTASPDSDGGDPAARMRQMQAYHIDSNGWCDIGYHFVVSQSGKLYQGRSDEQRPGAHVGNQNAGNIGISFIGNYQVDQPPQAQLDAAASLMKWVKDTYNIPWDRDAIRGHRQWPGQSTSCPGDNLLAKIDDLMAKATDSAPKTYPVEVKVNYLGAALKDQHNQGTSAALKDVLPGDTFQAELSISNRSDTALRAVKLGYWFEQPFISATGYTIQTDHPAKDGKTWMTNDADAAPENPAKESMGQSGELVMYAFGPGETKRVLVELRAEEYSLGLADHPDVRMWVKHIEDLYGEQAEFNQPPAINKTGDQPLQAYAQLDVLDSDQWQFDGGEELDTESWSECDPGAQADQLINNTQEGALSLHVTGDDSCLLSPSWTKVDADRYDQLVLRLRAHDGQHALALYWAKDGEPLSETRKLRILGKGDGQFNTYVIPMSAHEAWSGTIKTLRIDPLEGAKPKAEASGWYDIDAIFFQSSADKTTSAPSEAFVAQAQEALFDGTLPSDPSDPNQPDPELPGERPVDPTAADDITVQDGCTTAPGAPTPAGSSWLVSLLALAMIGARRFGPRNRRRR